jgi:uncharacterized protein
LAHNRAHLIAGIVGIIAFIFILVGGGHGTLGAVALAKEGLAGGTGGGGGGFGGGGASGDGEWRLNVSSSI